MEKPTNMGRLVANHQIKFIHGRSHAELEADVNKWLTANLGKYEIKEIKLDFSQSGARLAMIHYYEHVRKQDADELSKEQYTPSNKRKPELVQTGTKHVAPSVNTPGTHNKKQSSVPIQPDLNSINNELDSLRPGAAVQEQQPKKSKIPEGYSVTTAAEPEIAPTAEHAVEPETEEPDYDNIIQPDTRGDLDEDEI